MEKVPESEPFDAMKIVFFFLKASLNFITSLLSVAWGNLLCSSNRASSPSGLPRNRSWMETNGSDKCYHSSGDLKDLLRVECCLES